MYPLLAEDPAKAVEVVLPLWPSLVIAALLLVLVVLVAGLVMNVNKMLSRLTAIRRHLDESKENGVRPQLQEATVQLQSMAVSLDRVAMRCDVIDQKLAEAASSGGVAGDSGLAEAVRALREGLDQLRAPVVEIRDHIGKTEVEKLGDEVKRTLYGQGYDLVVIRTDLASLVSGEGKVQVDVTRSGVKSKGYVLLRAGSAVETKISPTYEMFP